MEKYKTYIKSLAENEKNVVFFNSGPEHAAWVMSTIFDYAKGNVKIYAGCFSGEISDRKEYRYSLEKYLRKGGELQVLLQADKLLEKEKEKKSDIFDMLRYYKILNSKQVEVKVHPFHIIDEDNHEIHFTVADNKMYRIEDNIVKFTAAGNFNDKVKAQKMSKLFDNIFEDAQSKTMTL